MVGSSWGGRRLATDGTPSTITEPTSYERQLSCQIWSLDGRMVARSSGGSGAAPDRRAGRFLRARGRRRDVAGVHRRGRREGVCASWSATAWACASARHRPHHGARHPRAPRRPVPRDADLGKLGRGLRPLRLMARDLAGRDADDMSASMPAGHPPRSGRWPTPSTACSSRSRRARPARAGRVTAFAAHELRTPIGGVKTRPRSRWPPRTLTWRRRRCADLAAVDRTTRLVRQLLDAARLDAAGEAPTLADVDMGALVAETVDGMQGAGGVRT